MKSILAFAVLIGFMLRVDSEAAETESRKPTPKRMGLSIAPSIGIIHPGLELGFEATIYNLFGANHTLRTHSAAQPFSNPDSSDSHVEVGYLIGTWGRNRIGYVSAGIGIAMVETNFKGREISPPDCFLISCTDDGTYEIATSRTVGLPFQIDMAFASRNIGIGLSIKGNINPDRSFGGVTILIPVGSIP